MDKMPDGQIKEIAYELKNQCLKYANGIVVYSREGYEDEKIPLGDLWLGPTELSPKASRLISERRYENTALALCDLAVFSSNKHQPDPHTIRNSLRLYRNTIDWFRKQSIFSLEDAVEDDWNQLFKEYADGNWVGCLSLNERWHVCIDEFCEVDVDCAFDIQKGKIKCLKQDYWTSRIGWGLQLAMTDSVHKRLSDLTKSIPKAKAWSDLIPLESKCPTVNMLIRFGSWIKSLNCLPATVDRIQVLPKCTRTAMARKVAKAENSRNANISVDDAALLMGTALKFVDKASKPLIRLLNDGREIRPIKKRSQLLQSIPANAELEKTLGIRLTAWCPSRHRAPAPDEYSVTEVIAAVQGAVAVIIASLSARRQREVCDRERGIRRCDYIAVNEVYAICNFYIEKTVRERVPMNITGFTGCLIKNLIDISNATNWFGFAIPVDASIFSSHSLGMRARTREKTVHLRFTNEGHTHSRSLTAFLDIAFKGGAPAFNPHMLRRMFGLIYYYRFEHPMLRALQKHYFHSDIIATKVYITDSPSKELSESIQVKIGGRSVSMDQKFDTAVADVQEILDSVARQKFEETVKAILSNKPCSGGFVKLVRKIYRKLTLGASFASKEPESQTAEVVNLLQKNKHKPEPFSHGQCNAPQERVNPMARCYNARKLNRCEASITTCDGCLYQSQFSPHIGNISEAIDSMREKLLEKWLSPIERAHLHAEIDNASRILDRLKSKFLST